MTASKAVSNNSPVSKKPLRKHYETPRLTNEGHMAQVTQKSGANADNSQNWPNKK